MITQRYLHERFSYNPYTGELRRSDGSECGTIASPKASKTSYLQLSVEGRLYRVHRLIWLYFTGKWPDTIDHINGDGLDNRWENLRSVSMQENQRNRRTQTNNSSGQQGVIKDKQTGRWQSSIHVQGKKIHLGRFIEFNDAVEARIAAERKYGFHVNHGRKASQEG